MLKNGEYRLQKAIRYDKINEYYLIVCQTRVPICKENGKDMMPMHEIEKPKSANPGGHFVFVSYSHADSDVVYPDILALQKRKIRIWYDEGLEPGEEWFQDVENKVNLPACIGVIFYISQTFLESEAVQKEIRIFSGSQKAHYFAINLLNAPILDKVCKTPGLPQPVRDTLLKLFHEDVTYLEEQDSRKLEKMDSRIHNWGYDPEAEFFPCGNVLHRGHVEYLPALLDLTPLNYTFFVLSNHLRYIDDTLNQVCLLRKGWVQRRAMDFLEADITAFSNCGGLVVVFTEREMQFLQSVLERRARLWGQLPLLAVFYQESIPDAFPQRVLSDLTHWTHEALHNPTVFHLEEYLLIQTDKDAGQFRHAETNLDNLNVTDRWRALLCNGKYHNDAVRRIRQNSIEAACGRWLLYQEPLRDTGNVEETLRMICPDIGVVELCSRDRFRRKIDGKKL